MVQLNTGLEGMPIEDAQAKWSEEQSPFRTVGRLAIPAQAAFSPPARTMWTDPSFSPAHTLVEHRLLGSVAVPGWPPIRRFPRCVIRKTTARRRNRRTSTRYPRNCRVTVSAGEVPSRLRPLISSSPEQGCAPRAVP